MKCRLSLDVTTSDEELAKTNEAFIMLIQEVDFPFVPFLGLDIQLECPVKTGDPRSDDYLSYFDKITDPSTIFKVEGITFLPQSGQLHVKLEPVIEKTIESFHAYKDFLTKFHGFKVFLNFV